MMVFNVWPLGDLGVQMLDCRWHRDRTSRRRTMGLGMEKTDPDKAISCCENITNMKDAGIFTF